MVRSKPQTSSKRPDETVAAPQVLLDATDEEVGWRSERAAPIPERCVLQFELAEATLFTFGFASTARADRAARRDFARAMARLAKAEGRGVLRLWAMFALTTLSCAALRSFSLRLQRCLTRGRKGEVE